MKGILFYFSTCIARDLSIKGRHTTEFRIPEELFCGISKSAETNILRKSGVHKMNFRIPKNYSSNETFSTYS